MVVLKIRFMSYVYFAWHFRWMHTFTHTLIHRSVYIHTPAILLYGFLNGSAFLFFEFALLDFFFRHFILQPFSLLAPRVPSQWQSFKMYPIRYTFVRTHSHTLTHSPKHRQSRINRVENWRMSSVCVHVGMTVCTSYVANRKSAIKFRIELRKKEREAKKKKN